MLTFPNNSFIVGSIMTTAETVLNTETIVQDILASIERERERERGWDGADMGSIDGRACGED